MVLLTLMEIFDIIFMTLVIGLIFMNFFKPKIKNTNVMAMLQKNKFFNKQGFINAIIVIAPAIILHEFGHKFIAMAFGLTASFHAAYTWLILALILRFIIPGFVFLVPAYVSISAAATPIQHSIIAFAGPAVNLLIFAGVAFYLIYAKHKKMQIKAKTMVFLLLIKKINLFLFIFNMLPIPGFDGFHVFSGLINAIF